MYKLFRQSPPLQSGLMKTNDGLHQIAFSLFGNPKGLPVICLHGGPGAGTSPLMPRFFNPERFYVLCFDQRGCGDSHPLSSLESNQTSQLLDDIWQLTRHLSFERFAIFGGSWGSTLAILFALKHPDLIVGLVLRGLFLSSDDELQWLLGGGASALYPHAWADFLRAAPVNTPTLDGVFSAYENALFGASDFAKKRAARGWNLWEYRLSVTRDRGFPNTENALAKEIATAQIEHYYLSKRCFIDANAIISSLHQLSGLSAELIHGENDHVCPVSIVETVKPFWPNLKVNVLPNVGHCAFVPAMTDALCAATDRLASRFGH